MKSVWIGAALLASTPIAMAAAQLPSRPNVATTAATPPARMSNAQAEARRTATFKKCMRTGTAGRGVTSGMMDCLGDETRVQDTRLNKTYRRVLARQSRSGKVRLQELQRAWIPERDATCKRASDEAGGGTLSMTLFSDCIVTETIRRTAWLERYRG